MEHPRNHNLMNTNAEAIFISQPWITQLDNIVEDPKWNYRILAVISGLVWFLMFLIGGKKYGVYWYSFLHSIVSGVGALLCVYLDVFAAEFISGTSEPLRTIRCEGPLTPLHNVLPVLTLGYAFTDVYYGLSPKGTKDVLLHGLGMGAVLFLVCELGVQSSVTPMLLMEVSSIPLNLIDAEWLSPTSKVGFLVLFALLFVLVRILIVPYIWTKFLWTYYQQIWMTTTTTTTTTTTSCFPEKFIYVILVFGLLFHGLNFYWVVLIAKKVKRKIKGLERVSDSKSD